MAVLEVARESEAAELPAEPRVRAFRPDVEGLRALAVTLVVLYHAGVPFLPGGYVGVDVFFVISGFLITTNLLGELRIRGRISLTKFYARRAKRLLPMATIVTLATLVATWLLTSALQTRQLGNDSVWAGLFAMNVHLARDGVDYQAADQSASALQHFWSLAVEEQFYLLWPLVLTIASLAWWRRRHQARRVSTLGLAVTIAVLALASFAYGVHETQQAKALAYFLSPARAWELAVGGLVAVGAGWLSGPESHRKALGSNLLGNLLAAAGLVSIGVAVALLDDTSDFPGYWALLPVLGTAAVLVAGLGRATALERLLADRPLVQGLGRISYGLYLWHWPLLVLAPAYLGVEELDLRQALAVVVVAVWLSLATFFVIEDPLRLLPAFSGRPGRALLLGLVLTLTVAGVGSAAARLIPDPLGDGAAAQVLDDGTDLTEAVLAGARTRAVPSNLQPKVSQASLDEPGTEIKGAAACHANIQITKISTNSHSYCVFGNPHGTRTVVLAGDSHAFQWLPALQELAEKNDWRLVSMTKAACPLYEVKLINTTLNRDYTECYTWRQRVFERIAREKPALVVTSGAIFNPRAGNLTERWSLGVGEAVNQLQGTGAKVVVLADTPFPGHDVPKCVAQHLEDVRACRVPVDKALSDPQRRTQTIAAAKAAGATVINPLRWLCGATGCPVIIGNTLVYRDNSHLTATYVRFLSSLLGAQLPKI